MTHNDILRHIRNTFGLDEKKMVAVFGAADHLVGLDQIGSWLKQEGDPEYQELSDSKLALFLNGLINHKRGRKEGPQPAPEQCVTNNIIFKKIKDCSGSESRRHN